MAEWRNILYSVHGGLGSLCRESADQRWDGFVQERARAKVWNAQMANLESFAFDD